MSTTVPRAVFAPSTNQKTPKNADLVVVREAFLAMTVCLGGVGSMGRCIGCCWRKPRWSFAEVLNAIADVEGR